MRVHVLLFHPFLRRSQINRTLYRAVHDLPGVHARDLYATYPEFSIDVEREQAELENADVVVFQHPFYWYNCPSLMKEWIDAVFERGWAYGPGGDKLKGKYWLQAISTGGHEEMYHREGDNRFTICELLRPFEQTARLCGMIPLDPFLVHGSFGVQEAERTKLGDRYRKLLSDLIGGKVPDAYSTSDCEEIAAAVLSRGRAERETLSAPESDSAMGGEALAESGSESNGDSDSNADADVDADVDADADADADVGAEANPNPAAGGNARSRSSGGGA